MGVPFGASFFCLFFLKVCEIFVLRRFKRLCIVLIVYIDVVRLI